MVFDDPATLTRKILHDELDMALLPVVDMLRYPQLSAFTSLMIGSWGKVKSIRLVSRVPIEQVRSYRRDFQSRSSNALVRLILKQYVPAEVREVSEAADAALYIGDRALTTPTAKFDYDLGELWTAWTGLPFIFATWVKRDGVDTQGWEEKLQRAYLSGKAEIGPLSKLAAQRINISEAAALDYLSNAIQYQVTPTHEAGLRRFHAELSLLEPLSPLPESPLFPSKVTAVG